MSGRSHQTEMDKLDQEWRQRLDGLDQQNQLLYKLATSKFTGVLILQYRLSNLYRGAVTTLSVYYHTQS